MLILGVYVKKQRKIRSPEQNISLLDPEKKRLVFNAVIKSHFNYCPLIDV